MDSGSLTIENNPAHTHPKKTIRFKTRRTLNFEMFGWMRLIFLDGWNEIQLIHRKQNIFCVTLVLQRNLLSFGLIQSLKVTSLKYSRYQNSRLYIKKFTNSLHNEDNAIRNYVKRAEIKLCSFMVDDNIPFRLMNYLTDLLKTKIIIKMCNEFILFYSKIILNIIFSKFYCLNINLSNYLSVR